MNTTVALNPAQKKPRGPRTALIVLLVALALLVLIVGVVHDGIDRLAGIPVQVIIDGDEVHRDLDLAALQPGHKLALAFGIAVAVLCALVVVPMALVLALFAMLLAVVFGLGVPALVLLVVAGIVLSPLIAIGALLVWILKRTT